MNRPSELLNREKQMKTFLNFALALVLVLLGVVNIVFNPVIGLAQQPTNDCDPTTKPADCCDCDWENGTWVCCDGSGG